MRELLIIGMGPGHPDQVTVQAVQALNRADVFFRIDKGDAKSGLNAARDEILRRHVTRAGYRVVDIPEPPRDRSQALTADGYQGAVSDWHAARAELIAAAIGGRARGGRRRARSWSGATLRCTTRCCGSSTGCSRSAPSPSPAP